MQRFRLGINGLNVRWKVIQHVREKISEPPVPFRVTPPGWAGPSLLAMLLFGSRQGRLTSTAPAALTGY